MPWFYVDDGFSDSKPVLNMPDRYRLAACGLWVLGGSWSAKEELDGFVPDSKLRQLGARPPIIAALTAPGPMSAPLCTKVSTGLQFNSWEKWQPTRAELAQERIENERKREAEAERKRAERAARNEANPSRSRRRRKGRNAVTSNGGLIAPVTTESCPDECPAGQPADVQCDLAGARGQAPGPDPTRPDPSLKNSGYLPNEVTLSSTPNTQRGTRLPDDWMPSPDVVAQMRADHPQIDLKAEHAKFIDHWQDQPGAKGRKIDWTGTWRNWIRRAAEQQHPRTINGQHGPPMSTSDLRVAQVQALKSNASALAADTGIPTQRLELE